MSGHWTTQTTSYLFLSHCPSKTPPITNHIKNKKKHTHTDSKYVTCGSAIKLHHTEKSKNYYLASEGQRINGRGSSGQQLVTADPNRSEMTSLWIVSEGHNQTPCTIGKKIPYGTKIRFTHVQTKNNLHSHNMRSPISNQQEVSGFGEDGIGDSGDDWMIQPKKGTKDHYWKIGELVYVKHADTGVYLGSTDQAKFSMNNCGRNCPVMDHLEVFGRKSADTFGYWKTETGIFLS